MKRERISPQVQRIIESRQRERAGSSNREQRRNMESPQLSAGANSLIAERMKVHGIKSPAYSNPMTPSGYRPGWGNVQSSDDLMRRAANSADLYQRYKEYAKQVQLEREEEVERTEFSLNEWRKRMSGNDPNYMESVNRGQNTRYVYGSPYANFWLEDEHNMDQLTSRQKEYVNYLKGKDPKRLESYLRQLTDKDLKGKVNQPLSLQSLSANYQRDMEKATERAAVTREGMKVKTEAVKNDPAFLNRIRENRASRAGSIYYNQLLGSMISASVGNEYRNTTDPTKYLTADEMDVLRYLVGSGESSRRGEIEEYADYLRDQVKRRMGDEVVNDVARRSKDNLAYAVAANAGLTFAQGLEYVTGPGVRAPWNLLSGRRDPIDYDRDFTMTRAKEAAQMAIKDRFIDDPLAQFFVDVGISATETAARLPLGAAGLGFAGLSAAASDHYNKRNSGANELNIAASSALSGVWEGLTEKFSLENLGGTVSNPPSTIKAFVKAVLKQGGVEASEEVFNETLGTLSDSALLREFSDYGQMVEEYKKSGLDAGEARFKAVTQKLKDIGVAGASGFVSGGVFGAGGSAVGALNTRSLGRGIDGVDYSELSEGIDISNETLSKRERKQLKDTKNLIDKLAKKQADGEKISKYEKGLAEAYIQNMVSSLSESKTYDPDWKPATEVDAVEDVDTQSEEGEAFNRQDDFAESETKAEELRVSSIEDRAKQFAEKGAEAYVSNYTNPTMPLYVYDEGFKAAYNAGRYDTRLADINHPSYHMLSLEQQHRAYEAGMKDAAIAERNLSDSGAQRTGSLILPEGIEETPIHRVLGAVAEYTGLQVELADEWDKSVNAVYIQDEGKIKLSTNAQNVLAATSHELTHFIRDFGEGKYKTFESTVVNALMRSKNTDLEGLVEEYTNRYLQHGQDLSRDEVMEEIVADATANFLNDPDTINEVVRKDKSIAQRIVEFFNDIVEYLTQIAKKLKGNKASNALLEQKKVYEKSLKLWMDALGLASENFKQGKTIESKGERFSIRTDENGEKVVVIDRRLVKDAKRDAKKFIRSELKNHIGEYYDLIATSERIYLGSDLPGEYVYSENSKKNRYSKEKLWASDNLDELIEIAGLGSHKPNQKTKHATDAKYGWYKHPVRFDVPIMGVGGNTIGHNEFKAALLIRHAADGKKYLYDMIKVEKIKVVRGSMQSPRANAPVVRNDPTQKVGGTRTTSDMVSQNQDSDNREKDAKIASEKKGKEATSLKMDEGGFSSFDGDVDDPLSAFAGKGSKQDLTSEILNKSKKVQDKKDEVIRELKRQLKETKGYSPDAKDVKELAANILKEYSSTYNQYDAEAILTHLFKYLHDNGGEQTEEIFEIAKQLSKKIIEESKNIGKRIVPYENKVILEDIRKAGSIYVDRADIAELNHLGGYEAIRRSVLGKVHLTAKSGGNAVGADVAYRELTELHPSVFPSSILNKSDMLVRIIEMADVLSKGNEWLESNGGLDYMSESLAMEIFDRYLDVRAASPTFADKKKQELKETKQKYRDRIKELKETAREDYRNRREKERLKTFTRNAGNELLKKARGLAKMKGSPEFLKAKEGLIGDLDLVSKGLLNKTALRLQSLVEQSEQLEKEDPDYIAGRNIKDALRRLNSKHVSDLNIDDIQELTKAIVELRNGQKIAGRLLREGQNRRVVDDGRKLISQLNTVTGSRSGTVKNKIDGGVLMELSPIRAFNMISGYKEDSVLVQLGRELEEGENKKIEFAYNANRMFDEFLQDKEFIADFKKQDIRVVAGGKEILISPEMRISLYLHSLNDDNKRHMKDGGLIVPNPELYKKGSKDSYLQGETRVHITPTELDAIIKGMTDKEKALAKQAIKFFNELSRNAINETSMLLDGYEKAIVDDYFPIQSDPNFLHKSMESVVKDMRIESLGILKERTESSNPILLEGISKVLTRQIENVGKYYGLAIPIRNFNKVYNFSTAQYGTSVKKMLSEKWGSHPQVIIEKLLADLQGGRRIDRTFFDDLRGNFARSVLSLNVSVAFEQLSAYPAAAAILDTKSLMKAMVKGGKDGMLISAADRSEINKYTKLLWYREQGNINRELGDIASQRDLGIPRNAVDRFFEHRWVNWLETLDNAVVGRLWYAAKYYVEDHHPELKVGSDAYFMKAAEYFERVVRETQSNYNVMQRSHNLRTDNTFFKTLFMFRTQGVQNFGLVYDAWGNYKAKRAEYLADKSAGAERRLKEAQKRFAKAVASQLVSNMFSVVLTDLLARPFLHRMWRYQDDEGDITWENILKSLGISFGRQLSGNIFLGGEIYDIILSSISDEKYYGMTVSNVEMINDFGKGVSSLVKNIFGYVDADEKDKEKKLKALLDSSKRTAHSIGALFGLPTKNVAKIAEGIYRHAQDISNNEFLSFKAGTELKESKVTDSVFDKLYTGNNWDEFIKSYNRAKNAYGEKEVDKDIIASLRETEEVLGIAEAIKEGDKATQARLREALKKKGFRSTSLLALVDEAVEKEYKELLEAEEEAAKEPEAEEYNPEGWYSDKADEWLSSGNDYYDFLYHDNDISKLHDIKDEEGKTITPKYVQVEEYLKKADLSNAQRELLWKANYTSKPVPDWDSEITTSDLGEKRLEQLAAWEEKGYSAKDFREYTDAMEDFKNISDEAGEITNQRKWQIEEYLKGLNVSDEQKNFLWQSEYTTAPPNWNRKGVIETSLSDYTRERMEKWEKFGYDIKEFLEYDKVYHSLHVIKDENGKQQVSKQEQVAYYISQLNISREKKTILWLLYYAEKNMPNW